jgi:hypothetical protein
MTTSTLTQTKRVLAALQSGEELTAKQIAARFRIASPTKVVSNIRYEGHAVYLNKHTDTKGRVTHKYRIGKPSRKLIAAGYRALAMGI